MENGSLAPNTFENIMENGAFAPKLIFHNTFKYIVFQRRHYGVDLKIEMNVIKHVFVIHIFLI